jgi:hypothetical protein
LVIIVFILDGPNQVRSTVLPEPEAIAAVPVNNADALLKSKSEIPAHERTYDPLRQACFFDK